MPSYDDPAADADEAAQALRGLAHASRTFTDPTDSCRVLGSLSAALASLQQSLDQLAVWHERNADRACHDDGDGKAGRSDAAAAGEYLRRAAGSVRQADTALNQAFNHNGRIAWQPSIDAARTEQSRNRAGRLAPSFAFGADPTSRGDSDPLGRLHGGATGAPDRQTEFCRRKVANRR